MEIEQVGLAGAERVGRRESSQGVGDLGGVFEREFLADELLCGWEVGSGGGVVGEESLVDGVAEQFAEWGDRVSDRAGGSTRVFELEDEPVDVCGFEGCEWAVAEAGKDVELE
jgi:hypothetical protein